VHACKESTTSRDSQVRSLKKLRVLGGGFELLSIGGRSYVRSVPGELNTDKNRVLELAQVGFGIEKMRNDETNERGSRPGGIHTRNRVLQLGYVGLGDQRVLACTERSER
jgi:hypothetical protein